MRKRADNKRILPWYNVYDVKLYQGKGGPARGGL